MIFLFCSTRFPVCYFQDMGRHNKDKRRAYMKRRRERKKLNSSSSDSTLFHTSSPISPPPISPPPPPPPSNVTPKTHGQVCINAGKPNSLCSSSKAAILRGEIPRKVRNDILFRKWDEYKLLYKQLELIKRRLNVVEFGERKGQMLNKQRVDIKR